MNCPLFPTKWCLGTIIALMIMAGSAFSADTRVGNFTATTPGNRSGGLNFLYWVRIVSPISGTIDSLGGSYRDNNDGGDSVMVIAFTNGGGGAPGNFLDSTTLPLLINNSNATTYVEKVGKSAANGTVTAGDTIFIATWVRAVTGAVGIARDGVATSDYGTFLLDTIRLSNSADAPPLGSPAVANAANAEAAHCVFMVIAAASGGSVILGGAIMGGGIF